MSARKPVSIGYDFLKPAGAVSKFMNVIFFFPPLMLVFNLIVFHLCNKCNAQTYVVHSQSSVLLDRT